MTAQNKYLYELENRLGIMEVVPLGEAQFSQQWTRENEGKLDYKNEFPNKIVFTGAAYSRLYKLEKSIYRCEFTKITIKRRCLAAGAVEWVPWFSGRLSLNDGAWNLDKCEVEIKLDDIKEEQCFEDNKTKEINLFQFIFDRRTVLLSNPNITVETVEYERSVDMTTEECGSVYWNGVGDPYEQGYDYYYYDILRTFDDNICRTITRWARETRVIACGDPSPGIDWILVADGCPGGSQTWARPPRTYGCTYNTTNSETSSEEEYSCVIAGGGSAIGSIDNGLALEDILQLFCTQFCPGTTVVSDFFQINPETPIATNYVTNLRSKVRYLTVFQKSDVKRPSATGNASKALWTFEKCMDTLVKMFNVRWRFEGDNLRIEHVSFFSKNFGFVLTAPEYAKYIAGKRKYSYDIEDIPAREEFKFQEAGFGDFTGVPIIYSGGCVAQGSRNNVKPFTVDKVSTDVQLCLSNPASDSGVVSDEGFCIVAADYDGSVYYMISEAPILGGSTLNNSLAWAQLHRDYYKYDRPLKFGNMNNVDTEFISTQPTKKGEKITIPLCCGDQFNPDDLIFTPFGTGIVDKATFNFKDETLELDLLYPSDTGLVTNLAPVAGNDTASTNEDTPISIDVLANDTDADEGDSFTGPFIVLPPLHGTAVPQLDGTVLYTPDTGYTGDDYFTYKIIDSWGEPSNNALVSITVSPPNVGPNAVNDSYTATQDTLLTKAAGVGLFVNDTDDVGFTLDSYDAVSVQGGAVAVAGDGSFTYMPPSGYSGPDSFTYTIIDAGLLTDTATVNITVLNPDNPVANDDNYQTVKNTNLIVAAPGLLANDTTGVGSLTVTAGTFATVQGGSVTISTDGSFTYTPPTGYSGNDSFDYTADNGSGIDVGTANIIVLPLIYVKLMQLTTESGSYTQMCGEPPVSVDGGDYTRGLFKLFFYSNAGGTVPFDVTGLDLKVNIKTDGNFYPTGTYTFTTPIPVFNTEWYLFGGSDYYYSNLVYDCDFEVVEYNDESISVVAGNYTII